MTAAKGGRHARARDDIPAAPAVEVRPTADREGVQVRPAPTEAVSAPTAAPEPEPDGDGDREDEHEGDAAADQPLERDPTLERSPTPPGRPAATPDPEPAEIPDDDTPVADLERAGRTGRRVAEGHVGVTDVAVPPLDQLPRPATP